MASNIIRATAPYTSYSEDVTGDSSIRENAIKLYSYY